MGFLHGNAVVGQSGGPTAAINATLAGVISGAMSSEYIDRIYGMKNGIDGLLADDLVLLNERFSERSDFERLKRTPAAALGSCRKKLPKESDKAYKETFERIIKIFEKYDIKYFFYIGGNDSMDTVAKLSKYTSECGYEVRVIGVPKTIDNDLLGTDQGNVSSLYHCISSLDGSYKTSGFNHTKSFVHCNFLLRKFCVFRGDYRILAAGSIKGWDRCGGTS